MKELIESTKRVQGKIDKCISNLVHSRMYHDKIEEAGAVTEMESLLVASAQQLQCLSDIIGDHSVIEWQTGEPKERAEYLVQLGNGSFDLEELELYEGYTKTYRVWSRYKNSDVAAWCKLSNIKPYKNK